MREIKFRVWFKDEKEMSEPFNIEDLHAQECYEEGDYYVLTPDNDILYGVGREIWLQYTGLRDKNGKEVYEGDIIKHNLYKAEYRVGYFEAEARFALYNKFGKGKYYLHFPNEFEVIGNIYENKELLKCDKL